jgi:histidinol dehydrogenase
MLKLSSSDRNFERKMSKLLDRGPYTREIEEQAKKIIDAVAKRGDSAVARFAKKFDAVELKTTRFKVSKREIDAAKKAVPAIRKKAINTAIGNVALFAAKGMPSSWTFSPRPGVTLGERFTPIERVAVYIPGGAAPLVSTVAHTAAVAKAAGVPEIVAATPPGPKGRVLPEILYALDRCGVKEIYRLGGVYAVAALALGTDTIRKVDKIVGPGNAYVSAAKKIVSGDLVGIDMVAGPSEVMVVADSTADPEIVAADLLSQIEHGSGRERAVLLTTSSRLVAKTEKALRRRAAGIASSSPAVAKALDEGVCLVRVPSVAKAVEIANKYAPEHLELMCAKAKSVSKLITAAGAVFIGQWTPEPIGDFVAGPSHVLPTGGTARFAGGLTTADFLRRTSVLEYTRKALRREAAAAMALADMEGLEAHGDSVKARL